jgi:C4-dicarboxylate-specific signal transduction histidine kinase
MEAHGAWPKVLTLTIAEGAEGWVAISVRDNGGGILPEHLPRIFRHGFTTKEGGHGFGLHSSAIAARDLGGVLRVESDGPGAGAVFTLELPVASPDETWRGTPSAPALAFCS